MQRLELSGAVRPTYGSLGVKRLRTFFDNIVGHISENTGVLLCSDAVAGVFGVIAFI